MIQFIVLLLIGIAGANQECNDVGRVYCYMQLYQNPDIDSKAAVCKFLPLVQECVSQTGCPFELLDGYLVSVIKSCDTECDFYKTIECSRKSSNETDGCKRIKYIKDCYSANKCEQITKENPDLFPKCGEEPKDNKRVKKVFNKLRKFLRRNQTTTTEQPTTTK